VKKTFLNDVESTNFHYSQYIYNSALHKKIAVAIYVIFITFMISLKILKETATIII